MKKLTASIFATLLTVVTVGAANANIASQGYVDEQVKNVSTSVSDLEGKVDTNTASITTLNGNAQTEGSVAKSVADAIASEVSRADGAYDSKGSANQALTDAKSYADTELAKKQNLLSSENVTVNGEGNVISGVSASNGTVTFTTTNVATSESVTNLEGRMDTAESDIDSLETGLAGKQNTLSENQLNAVNSGITTAKVSAYDAYANQIAGKADKATTLEGYGITDAYTQTQVDSALDLKADESELANYATTSAMNTALGNKLDTSKYNTEVGTVSAQNMGTTASTVVTAISEVNTKAGNAATAAAAAQNDVDALEGTVTEQGERLTSAEGDIDTIQGQISNMATSSTVTALQGDVAELQTNKQDKTDNSLETTAKTVAGAINEVKTTADNASTAASTAQGAAETAQTTADKAVQDAAAAKAVADAAIPDVTATGVNGKYVLTAVTAGDTASYKWELIERSTTNQ